MHGRRRKAESAKQMGYGPTRDDPIDISGTFGRRQAETHSGEESMR